MKFSITLFYFVIISISAHAQMPSLKEYFRTHTSTRVDTTFILSSDDKSAELPVTLITGHQDGPTFALLAGIHGMEYPTILSLMELRDEIDPGLLKGNLIIIPIANVESFFGRTPFVNPLDNVNLNRAFPGNKDGSITQVMADFFSNHIYESTDILLDLHGGDVNEDLIPFICYYDNKQFPQQTKLASKLSEVSTFDTIVSYPYILKEGTPTTYAFKEAVEQDITALSIEIGKLGNWNKEEVEKSKESIYNMLSELNMYGNKNFNKQKDKIRYGRQAYVSCPLKGIFYSEVEAGQSVKKDAVIGHITDIFGKRLKTITSPQTGVVLYKISTPPVNVDETLLCIGY